MGSFKSRKVCACLIFQEQLSTEKIITVFSNKLLRDINYFSKLLVVNIGKLTNAEPYKERVGKSSSYFMMKARKVASKHSVPTLNRINVLQ